ncbi:MAG: hypothetical protein WEB78_11945 [Ilumatobacteraceae bacterium]
MPPDRSPIPAWLRGCWRREWIQLADGSRDDTETVYWLQTDSAMADVRTPGMRPSFAGVDSLEACSVEQLSALARNNASTGFTTATDVETGTDGSHRCTAQWHTYGFGINLQPVCTYPEPGLLTVDRAGTTMIERAPSGAYVEQWVLVPGSADGTLRHEVLDDGRHLFVAGPVAVTARDRRAPLPRIAPLSQLVADPSFDRPTVEGLLDCEFSVALRSDDDDGEYRIITSTLPWREGALLDVDP